MDGTPGDSDRCPAATGFQRDNEHHHACQLAAWHPGKAELPVVERILHECQCGAAWTSLMGTIDALIDMSVGMYLGPPKRKNPGP